jgi:hypothetical protein
MAYKSKTPPIGDGRRSKCLFAWAAIAHQLPRFLGIEQAKNLAALIASIDPAHVAGLAFVLIGGPRQ